MDTVSKYDIAEVVSHIGSQTLLPSSNLEGGVEFGGLLARAIKSEEAAKAARQVDESGEDLPISVLDLTLGNDVTGQQSNEDQFTQPRESNPTVLQHLEHIMQAQIESRTMLADMPDSQEEAGIPDDLGIFPSESERDLQSLSLETLIPEPLIRVATLREKRRVILGPENSALATTFAQGARWHLAKDIESASETSLGVTTSSFARAEKEGALAISSRSPAARQIKYVAQRVVTESAAETENNYKAINKAEAELLKPGAVNLQMQVNEPLRSGQRAAAWTSGSEIETSPRLDGSSKKLQQAALRFEVGSESTSVNNSSIKEEGGGAAALFSRVQQTQMQEKLASEKTRIQIKLSVTDITADNTGASQNSAKTGIERFDAHLPAVEGQGTDLASVGLSAANSFEKPQPTARFELASRPVLVSNFAADMKETIVGQLAKVADGVTKFTVALYPENFGKVNVEISYSEIGGLRISMAGDNPESIRVLEQNLPALRESLQNDKLSELVVNLNSNQDSQGSSSKNGRSNNNNAEGDPVSDPGTADLTDQQGVARERQLGSSSEDGLDTYV